MTHHAPLPVTLEGPTTHGSHTTLVVGDVRVTFQRTLRIPDDGRTYPLPPGLGAFPLRRVDDLGARCPAAWRDKGGVILPMYQREAMWLRFSGPPHVPHAIKVAAGKVCAITGKPWQDALRGPRGVQYRRPTEPQDYVVSPPQPWLDGIAVKKGVIRQFVAMPLGLGYTVEGQVTGHETEGGVQLRVVPPKPGRFPERPPMGAAERLTMAAPCAPGAAMAAPRARSAMGLAAGGRMKQDIYPDPHGIDTWDERRASRVFVHLVSSTEWRELTGEDPPPCPISAQTYAQHGLPYFDVYGEGLGALAGSDVLESVASVKEIDATKSTLPLQNDESVSPSLIKKLIVAAAKGLGVRDGEW